MRGVRRQPVHVLRRDVGSAALNYSLFVSVSVYPKSRKLVNANQNNFTKISPVHFCVIFAKTIPIKLYRFIALPISSLQRKRGTTVSIHFLAKLFINCSYDLTILPDKSCK